MVGISGGGTVVCWLAQNRADLHLCIPIAAMLGVSFVPAALTRIFAWLFEHLPSFYMWWDPLTKDKSPYCPPFAYPGYPIHALSEVLKLGVLVQQQAKKFPPLAKKIIMVINDHEPGVSNPELEELLSDWRINGKTELVAYHFEKELNLPHDIITQSTPGLDIELVYSRLIALISAEELTYD